MEWTKEKERARAEGGTERPVRQGRVLTDTPTDCRTAVQAGDGQEGRGQGREAAEPAGVAVIL